MTETTSSTPREISIPRNMQLKELDDKLEFEYNWYKPKYIVSIIAAPVFTFFLIKSDFIAGDFNQLTVPVIILMALACISIYYSLAKLVNTTRINVTHEKLEVYHGPVPFGKNLTLKKENVTQLYVTKHRTGHRYYLYSTTYQINVILKSTEVISLVKGLHTPEQGRFIEQKIEDFLDIKDIHVEGELAKE
jgi:hypothetical protein